MSSNDDDDARNADERSPGDDADRIVPDRQWVLRPDRVNPAAPATPPPPPGADSAPDAPTAPPPGATPSKPTGSNPTAMPQRPRTPTIDAPRTSSPPSSAPAPGATPAAPSKPGGLRSWGSQPDTPVTPAPAPRPSGTSPWQVPPPSRPADPPTLTPSDTPTSAAPVAQSTSPSSITFEQPAHRAPAPPAPGPAPAHAAPAPAPAHAAASPAAPGPAAVVAPAAGQPTAGAAPSARAAAKGDPTRPRTKSGPTVADLAQQLAATQAQVAALSAQLTTLAHRLTYDVERGAQTTSERVVRELERTLAEAVAQRVGAHIGPVIDDLIDQVAEDFTPKLEAVHTKMNGVVDLDLAGRLSGVTDAIDSLPMGNLEVLNQIEVLSGDLQDRFQRFSTRIFDQLEGLERTNLSELLRLRDHLEEIRTAAAAPSSDVETLRRIAGHVERLAQRTPGTAGIVAAVETLITEHLDSVRQNLDEQVATLAPTLQVELDAVRAENSQSVGAIEHELLEQVATIEAGLSERIDNALADHLDGLDHLLTERQEEVLAAVSTAGTDRIDEAVLELTNVGAARLEEVAAVSNLGADRLDDLATAVQELQAAVAENAGGAADTSDSDDLMATVIEELQALRRRITLRIESDEEAAAAGPTLSAEQVDAIASAVVSKLGASRAAATKDAPKDAVKGKDEASGAHLPRSRGRARK